MKRAKKIVKWTGIVLLTIVLAVTALTASRQNLTFEAPVFLDGVSNVLSIVLGKENLSAIATCHGIVLRI